VPSAQLEQVLQTPPSRYLPAAQPVQSLAVSPLQVAQLASHCVQTVSAVAEQAALANQPGSQVVQLLHTPPLRYSRATQLVQLEDEGPSQVAQLKSHCVQVVSAVGEQAALANQPRSQVVQVVQTVSAVALHAALANVPAAQVEQGPNE